MQRFTITEGARTSANGVVRAAGCPATVNGARIVLEGDPILCPACRTQGKVVCIGPRIAQTFNGKAMALSGDLCACGCFLPPKIISQQTIHGQFSSISQDSECTQAAAVVASEIRSSSTEDFEQFFVACRADEKPVELAYCAYLKGAPIAKGYFNAASETARFPLEMDVDIVFWNINP